jgi:hypothetical protein
VTPCISIVIIFSVCMILLLFLSSSSTIIAIENWLFLTVNKCEHANFQLVVLGVHLYYSKWLLNIYVQSH